MAPVTAGRLSAIVDRKNRLVQEFADYRIAALRDPQFCTCTRSRRNLFLRMVCAGALRIRGHAFVICHRIKLGGGGHSRIVKPEYRDNDECSMCACRSRRGIGRRLVAVEFSAIFFSDQRRSPWCSVAATLLSDMDRMSGQAGHLLFQDEGIRGTHRGRLRPGDLIANQ